MHNVAVVIQVRFTVVRIDCLWVLIVHCYMLQSVVIC